MSRFNHVCQYYFNDINKSKPQGIITLRRLTKKIKNPKPKTEKLIKRIRDTDDKAKRDKLKTYLPAFTPCVFVKGRRRYKDISGFTQIASLDFDGLPSKKYANDFKQSIFNEYKSIFATWCSPSGKGVRAFVRIPPVSSPDEFKLYFAGLEKEFGQYKGFDSAPKNCVLPLFYSIDRGLLRRDHPTKWEKKYIPPEPKQSKIIVANNKKGKAKWVIKNAQTAINKITGNGHPQLRACAYTVGGYVGGGYLTENEAIALMDTLIEGNAYLSKKPQTYKRTSRTMIRQGQSKPLYFT